MRGEHADLEAQQRYSQYRAMLDNVAIVRKALLCLFYGVRLFLVSRCLFLRYRGGLSLHRELLFGIEILHSVVHHLDRLLPGINPCVLCGPRHPVNWRSMKLSGPQRRSKISTRQKQTSRYQRKESPVLWGVTQMDSKRL